MSATSAGRATPRRTPFVAVVVGLLAVGLIGQLLLNTALQRGSFQLHDMTITSQGLEEQQQALQQQLARRESPASLAADAAKLGMVPSGTPVFLRLADGSLQGTPTAAPTPPPPTTPPPTPGATDAETGATPDPATAGPADADPADAGPADADPAVTSAEGTDPATADPAATSSEATDPATGTTSPTPGTTDSGTAPSDIAAPDSGETPAPVPTPGD